MEKQFKLSYGDDEFSSIIISRNSEVQLKMILKKLVYSFIKLYDEKMGTNNKELVVRIE